MKLFEYMATGRPIVASDVGEVRRILANGQAGYIVDPSNPREIASAIAKVARSPKEAEKKGQRARKRVHDHYRWELLARRVRTVVDDLLDNSDS
jgi:glycosyltransferase involved in cell wall biosynthesis